MEINATIIKTLKANIDPQSIGKDVFDGFDVEYAKERSRKINAIPNIDKKRIGNLDYWTDFVRKYNLD